ncbi:hypothetical protein CRV24_010388 [Beauveria bassiana]|nr:hypothetical protein CRV24_010388 [Beauveria bassiana]KAH8713660.1 hypothetical protein HC256_006785 [Beauveria bassiana]
MSEPSYTYIRISKTDALESSAQKYRHLRLQGLESSPESFSSTYEIEAAFSNDEWIQRLSAPDRETFICVAKAASEQDAPGIGDWVGQVTLRGPMSASEFSLPKEAGQGAINADNEERWQLLGLFLLPAHRGGGRGSRLCREALNHLQRRQPCPRTIHVRLMVKPDNQTIVQMYERLGFVHTGQCTLAEAMRAAGDGHLLSSDTGDPKYSNRSGIIMSSHLHRI